MELKGLPLYFIVGVVFIIASWLISYVLRVVLYPLWLVATAGQTATLMAVIIAFIIIAIVTGWLVIEVAKRVGGLK